MNRKFSQRLMLPAALLTALLAACGGGDGGNGSEGPPPNTAPTFTSAGTASVAENTTGAIYQAGATDAQGDTITYSIGGGADASAFGLSGNALSFVNAPNYDLPVDANADNVYEVTLRASDGTLASTLALAVTVTNDKEGISVKRIASLDPAPVAIATLNNGSALIVALSNGTIRKVDGTTGAVNSYYAIHDLFGNPVAGLKVAGMTRAIAASNGTTRGTMVLADVSGSARAYIIDGPQTGASLDLSGTDAGDEALSIGTGPDGFAYVGLGDATGSSAQDVDSRLGKLVRVRPNPDPFAGTSPAYFLSSTVGVGLRAPSGVTSLPDGRLAIFDRGATSFDELSLTAEVLDVNFGWPYFEGLREVNAGGSALSGLITPSLVVPRGDKPRESRGIVGGALYAGAIAGIANHLVLADKDGRIWSIPFTKLVANTTLQAGALEVRDEDFKPDAGTIDHPIGFALDANGTLYILDRDGEIFRVDAG